MNKITFEPKKWHACTQNDWQTCESGVNCYSYVLDRPDYYWSVPGEGFVKTRAEKYFVSFNAFFSGFSQEDFHKHMIQGAMKDSLIHVEEPVERPGYYLSALFFAMNEYDFHWYRKDDDGFWSHKNGWHPVKETDDAGNHISDPRTCAHSEYPIFGGYFLAPRDGVTLTKRFPLIGIGVRS
ncbi:MAG: hypothetical protein WC654_02270 [Patescibacteria group bacterium]